MKLHRQDLFPGHASTNIERETELIKGLYTRTSNNIAHKGGYRLTSHIVKIDDESFTAYLLSYSFRLPNSDNVTLRLLVTDDLTTALNRFTSLQGHQPFTIIEVRYRYEPGHDGSWNRKLTFLPCPELYTILANEEHPYHDEAVNVFFHYGNFRSATSNSAYTPTGKPFAIEPFMYVNKKYKASDGWSPVITILQRGGIDV